MALVVPISDLGVPIFYRHLRTPNSGIRYESLFFVKEPALKRFFYSAQIQKKNEQSITTVSGFFNLKLNPDSSKGEQSIIDDLRDFNNIEEGDSFNLLALNYVWDFADKPANGEGSK
jgi:hypothetical protein|tara:strand:+ start:100 stop:450 length:351 start_codon:yes stop_codon:yes gene_type:complete